jgi:hypothetical protein
MGVASSQPQDTNKDTTEVTKATTETTENTVAGLHNKIIETGNKLIKRYKDKFLNEQFCDNLQFVMGKKLAELDVDSLENLNDKISSGVSVYRKVDESNNQEYILKSLGDNLSELDNLKEYFDGNSVQFNEHSSETIPKGLKIKFISEKIRDGIMKELQNYNKSQKGGGNENGNGNENEDNSNDTQKTEIVTRLKGIMNNNKNKNNNKNNVIKKSDDIYERIQKLAKEINTGKNNKKSDGFEEEGNEEGNEEEIAKEINENEKTSEKLVNEVNKASEENEASEANKEETEEESEESEEKEENNKNVNKKNSNVVNKNGYKLIKYRRKGEKSVFTKSILCRAISDHYKVRINIISAILSVIPYNYKNTELSGFCEERLKALREGTICLPDNSFERMKKYSVEEGVQKLSKTINNFTKGRCEKFKGFLMKLSTEQLESLKKGSTGLNKQYKDSYLELKRNYRENLIKLLDILDELRGIKILNNASLNTLSEKVKDLIQTIYNNCQLHYYNAVIALIHANLNAIKEQQDEDDKQQTLKIFSDHIIKRSSSGSESSPKSNSD